jgi:hypothetical protein
MPFDGQSNDHRDVTALFILDLGPLSEGSLLVRSNVGPVKHYNAVQAEGQTLFLWDGWSGFETRAVQITFLCAKVLHHLFRRNLI